MGLDVLKDMVPIPPATCKVRQVINNPETVNFPNTGYTRVAGVGDYIVYQPDGLTVIKVLTQAQFEAAFTAEDIV